MSSTTETRIAYGNSQSQGHFSIDHLKRRETHGTTSGYKTNDITPSIIWRRVAETLPAGTKPRTSRHRSSGGERQRHYQRAQSQAQHFIDHPEESG